MLERTRKLRSSPPGATDAKSAITARAFLAADACTQSSSGMTLRIGDADDRPRQTKAPLVSDTPLNVSLSEEIEAEVRGQDAAVATKTAKNVLALKRGEATER